MPTRDKIARGWCLVRNKVLFPRGRPLQWALRRSIPILIIVYIVAHLGTSVVFSLIYQRLGGVYENDLKEEEVNCFWSLLYFSLTTQTTLGYGDLVPVGKARIITAAQTGTGIILNALVFGVIVTKLIRRSPRMVLPKKLAYDHRNTKYLYFQLWNRDADHYVKLDITLEVIRTVNLSVPPYQIFQAFPVVLDINFPDIIDPNRILTFTTISEGIDAVSPPPLERGPNKFAITCLKPSDELQVVITAVSVSRGDHVAVARTYTVKDIECGTYSPLRPYQREGDRGPKEFRNFGKVSATDAEDCKKCEIFEKCPLSKAINYRNSKKSKTSLIEGIKGILLTIGICLILFEKEGKKKD